MQLRDVFNLKVVAELGVRISEAFPAFQLEKYGQRIEAQLEAGSFNERMELITRTLRDLLPQDYPRAVEILIAALGPELSAPELEGYGNFIVLSLCKYVSDYGRADFDLSMGALHEMTRRFSAEFAIRPFLIERQDETLAVLGRWVKDPNCHVRRLVSEGTRPRLPLGSRLPAVQKDPAPVLALLDQLMADPELYVRRSVANNLNDISKDNPDQAVAFLNRWREKATPEIVWIIKHSLRTLIKQAHPGALELMGVAPPKILVQNFSLSSDRVVLGQSLDFRFDVLSEGAKAQQILVDYQIHYMKKNGKTAPKVFKLTQKALNPGERLCIAKSQSFKKINTRTFYQGEHVLVLQINGASLAQKTFFLEVP